MNGLNDVLSKCILCNGLSGNEIKEIFENLTYSISSFKKDSILFFEDDECTSLGIVLDGMLEVRKIFASGKTIALTRMGPGNIFGEVIVFSKSHKYPNTIAATIDSKIMLIKREAIAKMCSANKIILENFMELLSNRILMMNRKLKELSFESIRQKICNYIIKEYVKQKKLTIIVSQSRLTMAEHMGIQRPSLSREFAKMKNDGLIDFDKTKIIIKDLGVIEEYAQGGLK